MRQTKTCIKFTNIKKKNRGKSCSVYIPKNGNASG